jgi:hypothetical protein
MTATEAAAALEEAELQRHMDRDREDLADDERGPAELAERARIVQLLADSGGVYDPDADAVVQDELAAEAERERDRRLEDERRRQEEEAEAARRATASSTSAAAPPRSRPTASGRTWAADSWAAW